MTRPPFLLDRARLARWVLLYAALVVYGSVVVGPIGFHYVPEAPAVAWRQLLAVRYVPHGPDQRPDWMANLVMLIPLGFMLTGALTPARGWWRVPAALGGFALSVLFVLAVKYAQLFFPGRTVTVNYIAAQGIGAALGTLGFALGRDRLVDTLLRPLAGGGRGALIALFGAYAVALAYFLLMPFDLVLSRSDILARLAALPGILRTWPGAGRPVGLRAVLVLAGAAAPAPLGALLALTAPRRGLAWLGLAAALTSAAMWAAELPILSATPMLVALGYRFLGIWAGAAALRALTPARLERARAALARAVPLLVPLYLLALAGANALLARHWRTVAEARAALDPLGLIPLWNDYIVSKSEALKSTVVHLVMYAPVGGMVWLRGGRGRRAAWGAGMTAGVLSGLVEVGRWFRPGLQPDFNEIVIGGLAAFLAVRWLPGLWRVLLSGLAPPGEAAMPPDPAVEPLPAPEVTEPTPPDPAPGWPGLRAALGLLFLGGVGWFLAVYPLPAWPLALGLAVYAAGLWRWPGLWLWVVPAALVGLDFTVWSGRMMVTESDPVLLVTLAVLLWRAPPRRAELWPRGWPGRVLAAVALVLVLETLRGLLSPYHLPEGSSDPYLLAENALRLAKGPAWAFVLMPFFRARDRDHGDALARFGTGMVVALAVVAAAGVVERAVFPGVFNFHSFYRIAATFSSVQFGGDDIGTFLAMAPPFLVVCLAPGRRGGTAPGRRGWLAARLAAGAAIGVVGAYALLVTYSRTAYGAAVLAALTTLVLSWPRQGGRRWGAGVLAMGLCAALAGTVLGFAADSRVMTARLATVLPDFHARWDNWTGGLAMMDRTPATMVFGMGLGTFPRVARLRAPLPLRPSNDVVLRRDGRRFLRIRTGSRFYFGQKVPVRPGAVYRLRLWLREAPGSRATAVLCEKLLLYSEACNGAAIPPGVPGVWRRVTVPLSAAGLDRRVVLGVLRRPVEFALFPAGPGQTVDFADVSLRGPDGAEVLRDGSFRHGTARWYPTDDSHLAWTIWNEYAATLFEGGALGLAAWLLLGAAALWGAARAALRGVSGAAGVAGAVVAVLAAGVFDDVLTAPRMGTVIYWVLLVAAGMGGRTVSSGSAAR